MGRKSLINKDKIKNFVEKNKRKILAGTIAASLTLSSILGFAGGRFIGNKEHEDAQAMLKDKTALVELLDEKAKYLEQKHQDTVQKFEDMKISTDKTKAEISEMIQGLAECVENDEYGQGERLTFDTTVKVIEAYVNTASLSAEDKQAIMTVVENLEEKFIFDNIIQAADTTFSNEAVKIMTEEKQFENGNIDYHGKNTFFMDDEYEVGIHYNELNGFSNVFISNSDSEYIRCDVELSDGGKINNPTNYKEGDMYGGTPKDSFCSDISGMLSMINLMGGEWSYDDKEDCYTVQFMNEGTVCSLQLDLNGYNLEGFTEKVAEDTLKAKIEGVTKEEYQAQYDRIAKLIEEAKALQEEQQNGGPSL